MDIQTVPCPDNPSVTTKQFTYNHSWQEIHDALSQSKLVIFPFAEGAEAVSLFIAVAAAISHGLYVVSVVGTPDSFYFANSTDLIYIDETVCDK